MVKKFIATFIFFITLFFSFPIYSIQGNEIFETKITPINNREYFPSVLNKIKNAKKSIYIIMYLASYYSEYPESPSNQIINALINKKKENIKIEIILEQSDSKYDEHLKTENLKTGSILAKNGITVYFDSPEIKTHSKLLIIDEKYVIIGSTNWSYSALEKNNETSVIIESPKCAEYYIGYFEKIKKQCPTKILPNSPK
ncbi:MAG TPA: phospholipase D-like domain-containing protein [Candidatus Ratteibacteria bacterium]|nr:phospholipase D-like domain-containing protein [Candidatus Ratteibacteria bacterium]